MAANRDNRRWSQRQAAREAGLTQSDWRRIEAGVKDPKLSTLLRIQRVFGLSSLEDLLGQAPSNRLIRKVFMDNNKDDAE